MRTVAQLIAVALLALVTGCSSGVSFPAVGPAQIDVDTPELRELKAEAGVESCRPGAGEPVEDGLPEVTLPCFGGGDDVDLAALRGPLVINLWASWCGPCRTEMPILQQFHDEHADRVPVLGIDYQDTQVSGAMELVQDSGVTYPLVADPQGALQGAGPFPGNMALPIFAFVGADGEATVVAGGVESVEELEGLVEQHLGIGL